jgi:hypothetical protein
VTIQEVELHSVVLEKRIWQMMTEQVPFGPLGPLYLALWTQNPATFPSAEVVGTGYERKLIQWRVKGTDEWENSNTIQWDAGSAWGDIDYYVFCDAATFGNILFVWIAGNSDTIGSGDSVMINPGDIAVSLQGTNYPAPAQ